MTHNIEIKVPAYISSSSYFFEQENSRCYVTNEKKHTELMLEGIFADLWYVLITTQDYNQVVRYAKSKNISNLLDEFWEELKITDLVMIDGVSNFDVEHSQMHSVLSQEADLYDKMLMDKRNWFIKNNFPIELIMELSYKCNLFCKHCYNDKNDFETSIDLQTAKKIIDEAIIIGVDRFYFTSGECTIHPDFIKILEYIRKKRKSFVFVTNGQALCDNEELFEKLVRLYPHEVRISLYSMNPEIHDYITNVKNSQKKTVIAIRKLRERDINVHINYFQMSINKDCISDVLTFKNEVGASMSADVFFVDNKNNNNSFVQASNEQLYELFQDEKSPYYSLLEYKNPCYGNDENSACKNIKSIIAINPSLDVYPCVLLKYKLGNLKENSLVNIWNNSVKSFWNVYKVKNLKDCKDCEYFEYCTYCPCLGMYENGFLEKSDICCNLTKIRIDILKKNGKYKNRIKNE